MAESQYLIDIDTSNNKTQGAPVEFDAQGIDPHSFNEKLQWAKKSAPDQVLRNEYSRPLFAPPLLDDVFMDSKHRTDKLSVPAVDPRMTPSDSRDPSPAIASRYMSTPTSQALELPPNPTRTTSNDRGLPKQRAPGSRAPDGREPSRKKRKPDPSILLPQDQYPNSESLKTTSRTMTQTATTANDSVHIGTPEDGPMKPVTPQTVAKDRTRPQYYRDYQLTGTEGDTRYLIRTWMRIDDSDIKDFLQLFHSYVRDSGVQDNVTLEKNDINPSLEGIVAILTKWQNIHQTRLNVNLNDCKKNGTLVGEHILDQAFKAGYNNILSPIASYFDSIVKDCEQEYCHMNSLERELARDHGDQSWFGCLQMDWNFFSMARDTIIEKCKAEQRRRSTERSMSNVSRKAPLTRVPERIHASEEALPAEPSSRSQNIVDVGSFPTGAQPAYQTTNYNHVQERFAPTVPIGSSTAVSSKSAAYSMPQPSILMNGEARSQVIAEKNRTIKRDPGDMD